MCVLIADLPDPTQTRHLPAMAAAGLFTRKWEEEEEMAEIQHRVRCSEKKMEKSHSEVENRC